MLDREEERSLAEIEAHLRADDPALHELFAKAPAARPAHPGGPPRSNPLEPLDPLDPFSPDDRTPPPPPTDPRVDPRTDPRTDPRVDDAADATADDVKPETADPVEGQAGPLGPYDDEAEQRHPSHVPQRRWDDGPDFDAELDTPPSVLTSIVRTFMAVIAAVALTTITTLALGPNVGGFVSVVAFCLAGMYGYQTIRGCPGLRRARGQG